MHILGISAYYHDSAAAVLRDGRIVAAAQEERFTRHKHDASFPEHAIASVLHQAGIEQPDLVAFYEKPLLKLERVLETASAIAPTAATHFARTVPAWFTDKLRLQFRLREDFGYKGPLVWCHHHEAHAASAFFLSPFEEAATLTVDGVGEWATNAIGLGEGHRVRLLQEIRFPHSLGLLYSAFTQYLGFKVNNGEYKVMGLAPYGAPRFVETLHEHLIDLREDGSYRLRLDHLAFLEGQSTIAPSFAELFGAPARVPDGRLEAVHMDVAASIQAVLEDAVLRQARHARQLTGKRNVVLAGGVALNSVANGRLLREGPFDDLWIQPAAGDAGGALGAALVAWHHHLDEPREAHLPDGMDNAYLGPEFDEDALLLALGEAALEEERLEEPELLARIASLVAEGKVVGLFQGRMEFGPRALGHRTILADARRPEMQRHVNAVIKFREGFRPFAPSVMEERASDWFETDRPSPYMLRVMPVAEGRRRELSADERAAEGLDQLDVVRSEIPAVTHVNDSARIQTCHPEHAPEFHALLAEFERQTGCPVMLNTSFNLRGEPIVCDPLDACLTFLSSGMDALAMPPFLVMRPPDRIPTGQRPLPPVLSKPRTRRQLRRFGVSTGLFLALIVAIAIWQGHLNLAGGIGGAAAIFLGMGISAPDLLEGVEKPIAWFGRKVSLGMATVGLFLLYLLVITPIGVVRRAMRDPLSRSPDPESASYWEEAEQGEDAKSYTRMY